MTGKPCPDGCDCGRHRPFRAAAAVPYALTRKALQELARWDAWRRQQKERQP